MTKTSKQSPQHFKGKDPLEHVVEAQAEGIVASTEIHGTEIPGHISAFADAARETALILLLFWVILTPISFPMDQNLMLLAVFSVGWVIWKTCRSAWLAWSRLERLHRVVAEERWEIEHHRHQERSELKELYAAKGFEGKLLEDVLDVLMADGDRTLRIMVQEELGLSLETMEHPLKQGLGAALGVVVGTTGCFIGGFLYPALGIGIGIGTMVVMGCSGALSAYYLKNKLIPAIIWNIAMGLLCFGAVHYLLQFTVS